MTSKGLAGESGIAQKEVIMKSLSLISQRFSSALYSMGYPDVFYERRPDILASDLRERVGVAAKLLSKGISITRTSAFDAIAKAAKFENWYQLKAHLTKLPDGGDAFELECNVTSEWFDALIPLLAVHAGVAKELPPDNEIRLAIEQFAEHLSAVTGVAREILLDVLMARLYGEKCWIDLVSRNPVTSVHPLYQFVIVGQRTGCFDWSAPCVALVTELDKQWQGYDRFAVHEQLRARMWVERMLRRRPDFLEAGLALAQMKADANERDALSVLETYLSRAEALIPKGYRGQILWGHTDNRFYHRMLWLQLNLHYRSGNIRRAVRIGRKMLRLNPHDNVGVRDCLPLMCLCAGEYPDALRSLKKIDRDFRYHSSAIRAFVYFANGDLGKFRIEMLTGLFTLPILRRFVENSAEPLPDGDNGYRGVRPDITTFADFARDVLRAVPGLYTAARLLLDEPAVLRAEHKLRRLWTEASSTNDMQERSARLQLWEGARKRLVDKLTAA
ncbi:TPA: hypothetical protein ACYLN4_007268 [Burkholderia lata]